MSGEFGVYTIRGYLKARSPVFHGGDEKTGSVVLLRREKFITPDGIMEIPVISGNSIRGVLRRHIFKDFLNQIGYEIDLDKKAGIRLYHTLFAGGLLETVDEKASGVIDLKFKRRVVELIPPAVLFGFSFGNQMIESKMKVAMALPVCTELQDYLPPDASPRYSIYELLTNPFQTRRDELKAERKKDEQAVQMLVEYEAFAPGTIFFHEFKIEDPTDLDLSCFARVLELWKKKPFLGGKSSIGLGEVEIRYNFDISSDFYLSFLESRRSEIVQLLNEMQK